MVTEPVARLWGKLAGVEVTSVAAFNETLWVRSLTDVHPLSSFLVPDPATAEGMVAWITLLEHIEIHRISIGGDYWKVATSYKRDSRGPTLLAAFAAAIEKLAEGEAK